MDVGREASHASTEQLHDSCTLQTTAVGAGETARGVLTTKFGNVSSSPESRKEPALKSCSLTSAHTEQMSKYIKNLTGVMEST